jgi:hypothetical protein
MISTYKQEPSVTPVGPLASLLSNPSLKGGVRKTGKGFMARCPAHDDKKPSLSISEAADGKILLHCMAGCSVNDVCRSLGIELSELFPDGDRDVHRNGALNNKIVATYDYTDEQGNLLFQAVRFHPKDFRQRKPDGNGGWDYSLKGVRRVLYRLPQIIEAIKKGLPIIICEGEKDADNLIALGFTATCNPMGAGKGKWLPDYSESLKGATVYILPDNDTAGREHAVTVEADLKNFALSARIVPLPELFNAKPVKDASDFISAGASSTEIIELLDGNRLKAKRLFDLPSRVANDPAELFRNGWLYRGGGVLFAAPTGIGKSVIRSQATILFALGRELFGICPTRPLSSLIIQAENDERDESEIRDGIIQGLNLSTAEIAEASKRIYIHHEDGKRGYELFSMVVEPLLIEHTPDLLWIDPALTYLDGETISQKDVGRFLRSWLNPVLRKYECGGIVIHHTNKPATGEEKGKWSGGDLAYLGSGSAEWANWPRASLAIRSTASTGVYELVAGKRGARLGWKEADGVTPCYSKFIAHSVIPGVIYWRAANPDEAPEKASKRKEAVKEDILPFVPPSDPIRKDVLIAKANSVVRIGKNKARDFVQLLIHDGLLHEWCIKRSGKRDEILVCRIPQLAV